MNHIKKYVNQYKLNGADSLVYLDNIWNGYIYQSTCWYYKSLKLEIKVFSPWCAHIILILPHKRHLGLAIDTGNKLRVDVTVCITPWWYGHGVRSWEGTVGSQTSQRHHFHKTATRGHKRLGEYIFTSWFFQNNSRKKQNKPKNHTKRGIGNAILLYCLLLWVYNTEWYYSTNSEQE